MNRSIIFIIMFILIFLFVLPLLLTFAIRVIPNDAQPSLNDTKKIYGEIILSQAFKSLRDNLSGIGTSIKNPNFANKKDIKVEIYEEGKSQPLRRVMLSGKNTADGKFVKIKFDPILDSKDKKYSWTISSPDASEVDAIEVFVTNNKPTWSLELKINNELSEESISYVSLHTVKNPTEILFMVFSDWKNKLTKDLVFLIPYSLTILLILLLLIFPKIRRN